MKNLWGRRERSTSAERKLKISFLPAEVEIMERVKGMEKRRTRRKLTPEEREQRSRKIKEIRRKRKEFEELREKILKHWPEIDKRHWEEKRDYWEKEIEKSRPTKWKMMELLWLTKYDIREKVWKILLKEHYLENKELKAVIKWIPKFREEAGEMLFSRNPTIEEARFLMAWLPSLRAKAALRMLELNPSEDDIYFILSWVPEVKEQVIAMTREKIKETIKKQFIPMFKKQFSEQTTEKN